MAWIRIAPLDIERWLSTRLLRWSLIGSSEFFSDSSEYRAPMGRKHAQNNTALRRLSPPCINSGVRFCSDISKTKLSTLKNLVLNPTITMSALKAEAENRRADQVQCPLMKYKDQRHGLFQSINQWRGMTPSSVVQMKKSPPRMIKSESKRKPRRILIRARLLRST